jgi:[ribosomal protein S5]-alanine N-acetyltransferase
MDLAARSFWTRDELSLFVLDPSDVGDAYVGWLNEPRINRYLESRFTEHTIESTREFVQGARASASTLMLGMRSATLGRHVGNIKLGPIDVHHGLSEIGLLIGDPNAWGRGVGRTAISILCDIAREQLGLRKLTAGCYESNAGSQKAFLAAGFVVEGRRERHFILDGQPEALVLMARWLEPAR